MKFNLMGMLQRIGKSLISPVIGKPVRIIAKHKVRRGEPFLEIIGD